MKVINSLIGLIRKPSQLKMAEREGFEPSMGDKTHTPLAGERLQPLGHLSTKWLRIPRVPRQVNNYLEIPQCFFS